MTQETSPALDRLHRVLVEEIGERRPELLDRSFTVAEIYQNLVPYRSHRDRIGVEMNADYEQALLELLAGEGDYLVLESRTALRQIREELESLNPDTGIYRDFAAVDVHLNPERLPDDVRARTAAGEATAREDATEAHAPLEPDPEHEPAGADAGGAGFAFADEPPGPTSGEEGPLPGGGTADAEGHDEEGAPGEADAEGETGERSPAGADDDGACRWCRGELPDRDDLHFCPHCGSPVDRIPCPDCGAELDPEWRFCVACGVDVGSG